MLESVHVWRSDDVATGTEPEQQSLRLADAPLVQQAVMARQAVMVRGDQVESLLGAPVPDALVQHADAIVVPCFDGSAPLGAFIAVGRAMPLDFVSFLAPIAALQMTCIDLTRQIRALMVAHRADAAAQQLLEELVQPLTVSVARAELAQEHFVRGEAGELADQIGRLRQALERLRDALDAGSTNKLMPAEAPDMRRCAHATLRLLAATH